MDAFFSTSFMIPLLIWQLVSEVSIIAPNQLCLALLVGLIGGKNWIEIGRGSNPTWEELPFSTHVLRCQ